MAQPTPAPLRRSTLRGPKPVAGRSRRLWVQYAVVFITFLLAINALVGERGLLSTLRVKKEYEELSRSLAVIRAENERLLETTRRLAGDRKTIEEAARRDLGLMRKGEVLVIVRDVDSTAKDHAAPPATVPAPGPAPR